MSLWRLRPRCVRSRVSRSLRLPVSAVGSARPCVLFYSAAVQPPWWTPFSESLSLNVLLCRPTAVPRPRLLRLASRFHFRMTSELPFAFLGQFDGEDEFSNGYAEISDEAAAAESALAKNLAAELREAKLERTDRTSLGVTHEPSGLRLLLSTDDFSQFYRQLGWKCFFFLGAQCTQVAWTRADWEAVLKRPIVPNHPGTVDQWFQCVIIEPCPRQDGKHNGDSSCLFTSWMDHRLQLDQQRQAPSWRWPKAEWCTSSTCRLLCSCPLSARTLPRTLLSSSLATHRTQSSRPSSCATFKSISCVSSVCLKNSSPP